MEKEKLNSEQKPKIKKVLLVGPPSSVEVYKESKITEAISIIPNIGLGCLAATLLEKNHEVRILDLVLYRNPLNKFRQELKEFNPDFVGISFTTPLYNEMKILAKITKEYDKNIIVMGGGPHSTSLPEQTLEDSELDIAVVGEGDYTIVEIVENKNLSKVKGIAYKKNNKIILTEKREPIKNMDDLPFPAWKLFEISKYRAPKIRAKANPVGSLETSRGCPFQCTFCNKLVQGVNFRPKSAKRVVDEIEYMLDCGFKEVHIQDDGFTTNINRAIEICDTILKRKLKFTWNIANGVRVDRVNEEFFIKAKKAGCHSIGFGIESGSQMILDSINKRTTLADIRKAIKLCKKAGIESVGYIIIGLPKDTEKTIRETINFAKSLDLDMAKATLLMPFPGTAVFKELDEQGLILSKDWNKYNYHSSSAKEVFTHPNLDWDTLFNYQNKFYKEFYFRPKKIFEEAVRSIKDGSLFYKAKVMLKTKW